MIRIKLLFLGPARDLAKVESAELEVDDGATVADVRRALADRYPALGERLSSIRLAVNQTFADDATSLQSGDEIALIPPVSGGYAADDVILVDLLHGPIPAERVRRFVMGDEGLGGITTFEGVTRREVDPQHGALLRLDYEAYESMARCELERMAREAVDRFAVGRVAIVHRLGAVAPGEVSVMISLACAHRAESFEACRWLIDTLKRDAPIWKKDVFEDGHVSWVGPDSRWPEGEEATKRT